MFDGIGNVKGQLRSMVYYIPRIIHNKQFRKRLSAQNFTIISQNCVGGVLYNSLGVEMMSPTINMFIEDENFLKLASNPKHYFSSQPFIIEEKRKSQHSDITFPVIGIDDIECCCLHYKNGKEAVDAWQRRCARVNYDKIYVVGNSWNMHENNELIEKMSQLPYPTVIFTFGKYNYENCVSLSDRWFKDSCGAVQPPLTDFSFTGYKRNYEELFDFIEWLNSGYGDSYGSRNVKE